MANQNPLALDNQLCFSLYSASLAMTQTYKPLLDPLGLTYPQYLVMLILWEQDGLQLQEIGRRLGQKSGALTPVIKRLEAEGRVQRVRDSSDIRALSIQLTPAGNMLREQGLEIQQCLLEACAIDITELIELKEKLDTLRKNLHANTD
ncbi:MarR family transcriptional regulator [Marinomonas piezotolerans]|uniref:MarR family transcriptional regulator n=2 Tax=Marinomonas piezotolerans TaxID=2213058 RepID=A0A370UCH7_9GAMM|nr:MarR family transcriptional regulator [Marinomonas piezotolerans]